MKVAGKGWWTMINNVTKRRRLCSACGFTLIELMIALAVGAVILAMALPSFTTLLERNRMRAAADELYSSLALARAEAVKRNDGIVGVCPATSAGACRSDGVWSDGWLVIQDLDGNGTLSESADLIVKRVDRASLPASVSIVGLRSDIDSGVTFEATGYAFNSWGGLQISHANSSEPARGICIRASGSIEYSTTGTFTDCGS